jgi:predicted nucleotidyltransferase
VLEVVTLAQRKSTRLAVLRAGLDAFRATLADYGRAHGGTFVLYGSGARGTLRHDSDVDLLVDFPDCHAAIGFAEEAAERFGLRLDVQPLAWCRPKFLSHIAADQVRIPGDVA